MLRRYLARALIALLSFSSAAAAQSAKPDGVQAEARAPFFLSSDAVRAMRDVGSSTQMVVRWSWSAEVLEGEGTGPRERSGTLRLGRDFVVSETPEGRLIYDFRLRRRFVIEAGGTTFASDSLFAEVEFFEIEAQNRAALRRAFDAARVPQKSLPGFEQHLYEANLRVRAIGLPPLNFTAASDPHRVSLRYRDEEVARVRFGDSPLTPAQGAMLARAIPHLMAIHPATLEAILPLSRLPEEVVSLQEYGSRLKLRSTLRLAPEGTAEAPYPLPAGLSADTRVFASNDRAKAFVGSVVEVALRAIGGTYPRPRPGMEDYVADMVRLSQAGEPAGAGLAWFAASSHYPDLVEACTRGEKPAYCDAAKTQVTAALADPALRRFVEASELCARGESEKGARVLAGANLAGKPHGYMASLVMFCLLSSLPPQKAQGIPGLGQAYPASAMDNALKAIEGNPYNPNFYFDVGVKFVQAYETTIAWRLYDLGRALGGGRRGDAFDRSLTPREAQLLSRYPGFF